MNLVKKIARNFVFPTLIKGGFERYLFSNPDRILNIYYHGVVKQNSTYFSPRHITTNQFELHLKYFVKNFDIITLSEAFNLKERTSKLVRPTITISFDDGYLNNYTNALPLLRKYNVKTTFFISGKCIENEENSLFWTDVIAFYKQFCQKETIKVQGFLLHNNIIIENGKSLKDFLKVKDKDYRDNFILELIDKCKINEKLKLIPNEVWQLMNSQQVSHLSQVKGIDIGTHGYNHYNLANIDFKDAMDDISLSKVVLEKAIEKPVEMICYPDGNYNLDLVSECTKIGLKKHICCDYLNPNDIGNPAILNRFGIANTTNFYSNMFFINKNFSNRGF